MNPQEDPRTLIGAMSDLEVRVASWLCNEPLPVTQTHLCNVLHRSDKTMARALYNLKFYLFCSYSELGWSITANVTQLGFRLPVWLQEAGESEEPVDTCPVEIRPQEKGRNFSDPTTPARMQSRLPTDLKPEEPDLDTPQPDVPMEKTVDNPVDNHRNFSDPGAPSSTSSSSILTNLKLEKNLLPKLLGPEPDAYVQPEPKFKPDPEPELEPVPEPEPEPAPEPEPEIDPKHGKRLKTSLKYQECYKTALAAGIWEEKASELAELEHVTPELITHHVQRVWAEGKDLPLAIWRIRKNWEIRKPPERKSQGYEDRQKYVTGKYADWVNH